MRRIGWFLLILLSPSLQLTAQTIDHWEMIVKAGDIWKYQTADATIPTDWSEQSFDDSSWSSGQGGFGYGDNDDGTTIANTNAVFLRIQFDILALDQVEKAVLLCDYDDAFVAYLNGNELGRSGISGSPPGPGQYAEAQHEAALYQGQYPDEIVMNRDQLMSILVEGANTLAIQVHNINATSSDLSSNFYLAAGLKTSSTVYRDVESWFRSPLDYSTSKLPIVKVNTNGRSIPDEPKIQARMGIIDNGPGAINHKDDPFTDYDGTIGIEIRGSSSQMFPKKQYAVETWTDAGADTSVSILGLPPEEDWVLYAPYSDKSLLRNVLAYKFSRELGWYAPRTLLVELYLNEQYKGIYVLTEKIKRDRHRVDISKLNPDENSGDDLTGGYIVKIDKYDGATVGLGWDSPILPPGRGNDQLIHFQFHYPREDRITSEQAKYIQTYVTNFEESLAGPNWKRESVGYRSFINVESFIDFSIINEITKNVDGYRLSTFLYKDRDSEDGKLHLGPVWDFNLGFGNANYCDGSSTQGWAWDFNKRCNGDFWLVPFWWERLLKDQEYKMQLKARWQEVRAGVLSDKSITTYIDSVALAIDDAQQRNFTQWPILDEYVWPNNYVGGSYSNEIQYLKGWIMDRMSWLDSQINSFELITNLEDIREQQPSLFSVYPNPGKGQFNLTFDQINPSFLRVSVFNKLGELIVDNQLIKSNPGNDVSNSFAFEFNHNPGVYIINAVDQSGTSYTGKLIIQ